jgi:hypothetical protein
MRLWLQPPRHRGWWLAAVLTASGCPGHQVEGIEAAHAIRQHYLQIGVVVLWGSRRSAARTTRVSCGRSVVDSRVVELLVEQRIRQAESPLNRLRGRCAHCRLGDDAQHADAIGRGRGRDWLLGILG